MSFIAEQLATIRKEIKAFDKEEKKRKKRAKKQEEVYKEVAQKARSEYYNELKGKGLLEGEPPPDDSQRKM